MYARRSGERKLTFDFAEGLIRDNLLVYDRETGSLWSQLAGRAVFGPLEGSPLTVVPSLQTTWGHWRRLHPDTRVVVLPGEEGRPYLYRNRPPGVPPPKQRPEHHDTSVLGLGLVLGDEAVYLPLAELAGGPRPLELSVGGQRVVVHSEPDVPTAWAEDAAGRLLPAVLAYEDGWLAFHPASTIYRRKPQER